MREFNILLYYVIFNLSCFCFINCSPDNFFHLNDLISDVPDDQQAESAHDVIKRLLPDKSHLFKITVDAKFGENNFDKFQVVKNGNMVEITGSTGVAATWGFNYYLKYYCNAHVGWRIKQLNIPNDLPDVNVTIVSKDRIRYYQNVCTVSYSFVWWNINDWQNHIDWMALNGINVALAPHGQEFIWANIYKYLNLSDEEINEHFTGPAFLSWQRMGNIRGWAGPLSEDWHKHTFELQKFVVKSMKNLGMIPALPAFAGFVPKGFKRLFPNAKFSVVEQWNSFSSEYCCPLFLDPTDPLFNYIGKIFLNEIIKEFGQTHIYYSDSFNEVLPTSEDLGFLKNVGGAIFKSMTDVDPKSIWLLQNWMFVNEMFYWTSDKVKTFLTSVPKGRLLILDLQSEQWPQYDRFDMYYGQPFIWNMLHNFGGTLGMFGDVYSVNNNVYAARNKANSTMVGIGITPEGINQNYVMYDLMLETPWHDNSVGITDWIRSYALRRYGLPDSEVNDAWILLMQSVYDYRGLNKIRGKYAITRRPRINISPWSWYSERDLLQAWKSFLGGMKNLNKSEGYLYDLVDLTRQVLQFRGDQIYLSIVTAFKQKNSSNLKTYSNMFSGLLHDLETILATNRHFLLGNWLTAAKNLSTTDQDKKQFEYNARNQITLWGPNGEIVDYANKQWSGIVADFFTPRWKLFLDALKYSLDNNKPLNNSKISSDILNNVEKPFTFDTKDYPTSEIGDTCEMAQNLFKKWYSKTNILPTIPIKKGFNNTFTNVYDEEFYNNLIFMKEFRDDEENGGFSTPDVIQI